LNYLLRLVGCLGFVGLLAAGVYGLCPTFLGELGLDVWELPNLQREYDEAAERQDGLDRRLRGALHRNEGRSLICGELTAGRISLAEAVRQMWALGDAPANLRWHLERTVPGASDNERMGRHVIDWTCELLRERDADVEGVRTRLSAELASWLRESRNAR